VSTIEPPFGRTAIVATSEKLRWLFAGKARYRCAWGGRGSGKSRGFARMCAIMGYRWSMVGESGIILCGREFENSLGHSSLEEVRAAIRAEPFLAAHYEVGRSLIRSRDGRIEFRTTGLRNSLDALKSKSRIKLLWVDEAEPVSALAWEKAIPTVREHDSEIWVTWNPERRHSATHRRFRENPDADVRGVEINWRDNPFLPEVLDAARRADLANRPDTYDHIWEGGFRTIVDGAYYAAGLAAAAREGRICPLAFEPTLPVNLFVDLGGAGARSDAFSVWPAQFVGLEIRVRDYYESVGQPLGAHVDALRGMGYGPDRAKIWLPHDGATSDRVYRISYESALRDAGYDVMIIPNQGQGAAASRIERARRLFGQVRFDDATTAAGREALGFYHERRDAVRGCGLGPVHDWSSHAADAFGLMCIVWEQPYVKPKRKSRYEGYLGYESWMG